MNFMPEVELASLERHVAHFPSRSDPLLQVLKGHLLVEESVRDLFTALLSHPKAIKGNAGASFEFHQIICLCEAIHPNSQVVAWAWPATKSLNKIRNNISHKLTYKEVEQNIDALISRHISDFPPPWLDFSRIKKNQRFENFVFLMCSIFAELKSPQWLRPGVV